MAVNSVDQANAEKWGSELARKVASVVRQHPEVDPENIRHALILLELTPEERGATSLLRGGARAK